MPLSTAAQYLNLATATHPLFPLLVLFLRGDNVPRRLHPEGVRGAPPQPAAPTPPPAAAEESPDGPDGLAVEQQDEEDDDALGGDGRGQDEGGGGDGGGPPQGARQAPGEDLAQPGQTKDEEHPGQIKRF